LCRPPASADGHLTVRTSASPRHDPRPWLLAASLLTRLAVGTYARLRLRARDRFCRSQAPWIDPFGGRSPPGFVAGHTGPYGNGPRLSCAMVAPAYPPLPLGDGDDGSPAASLALPAGSCETGLLDAASRYRRVSPLQTCEDQSLVWGIGLHALHLEEGTFTLMETALQDRCLAACPRDHALFQPTTRTPYPILTSMSRPR
jgi:hypothetical protein